MTNSIVGISPGGWKLYAEGGANILYSNEEFPGRLLRLRKTHKFKVSTKEVYGFMENELVPRLGRNWIVKYELVELRPGFFDSDLEQKGLLDWAEEYALIVDNARNDDRFATTPIKLDYGQLEIRESSIFIEFKPKWLVQSPNAPPESSLCRTCAHREMTGRSKGFCPLDLGSKSRERIRNSIIELLERFDYESCDVPIVEILTKYFMNTNLLYKLKDLQCLDESGINNIDKNFLISMSARDCTLFIEIIDNPNAVNDGEFIEVQINHNLYWVKAKLADLDLKSIQKSSQWIMTEKKLREYYTNSKTHCII